MTATYDESRGIVHVVGRGQWTVPQVREHFAELDVLVRRLRLRSLPVMALIDLRESSIQSQEVTDCIASSSGAIYQESDRVAIIVQSSLMKMQMKRASHAPNTEIFISPSAAETWLTAYC